MTERVNFETFYRKKLNSTDYKDWIKRTIAVIPDHEWCAVTFTLKQLRHSKFGFVKLTHRKCEDAIGDFLCRFNARIYGNDYSIKMKPLGCIPIVESSDAGMLHIHLLLQIPGYMVDDREGFKHHIFRAWQKCPWSDHQRDVQFCGGVDGGAAGWSDYIMKDFVKNESGLCLNHMQLPQLPQHSNSIH